jgi:hypothetical protein
MGMNPRLLRPTPTGFDPRRIANLTGWWDATDASTITLNGTTVSQWRDKSGGNRHMAQDTAADQPEYLTSEIGGKAAVKHAASPLNRLFTASFMDVFADDTNLLVTIFAVVRGGGTGTNNLTIGEIANQNGFGWYLRFANQSFFNAGATATARISGVVDATAFQTAAIYAGRRSGGTMNQWFNGSLVAGSRTDATGGIRTTGNHLFGISGTNITMSYSEIIIYNRDLSTAERDRVQSYLARKYGVTRA